MSLSKLKQKLKHYKSLQNLYTIQQDTHLHTKVYKQNNNHLSKQNKTQKNPPSRLATQINDKMVCSKQDLKKYVKIFKNKVSQKKIDSRHKNSQTLKLGTHTASAKKVQTNKISSPIISRYMPKKEITEVGSMIKTVKLQKKRINTNKYELISQQTQSNIDHIHSVFMQKSTINRKTYNLKKLCPKDKINHNRSKSKIKKLHSEASLQSTPSCIMSEDIELMDLIGEGTFGKVFKARLKKTSEIIAIKRVLQDSRYKNRQIQIVRMLNNDFVMQVLGSYITYESGQQYLNIMMKYYEENLYCRIKDSEIIMSPLDIKIIIYQIFKGLSYLHSLNICHRDIKPENILLRGNAVAICDFGSAKILNTYENNISYICARCYRAPQLIFGSTNYTTLIDIWSAGCVILEILNSDPLFIADTSITHLHEIMKVLGTPTLQQVISMNPQYDIKDYRFPNIQKRNWIDIFPHVDKLLVDLIEQIMVYTPSGRVTAVEALSHPYFDELRNQQTYLYIQNNYKLNNFFDFSQAELPKFKHLKSRLIPTWLQ